MSCKRHNSVPMSRCRLRDLFRKTYWLSCVRCNTDQGPYTYSDMINELDEEAHAIPYGAPTPPPLPPPLDTRFDDDDDPGGPITFYCADAYRKTD